MNMDTAMLNILEKKYFRIILIFLCMFIMVSCSKPISYELGTVYKENASISEEELQEMNTYTVLVNVLHDRKFIQTGALLGRDRNDYLETHYENNPVVRELISRDDFVDAYLYAVDHLDEIEQSYEEDEWKGIIDYSLYIFLTSKRCLEIFEDDGRIDINEWYKAGGTFAQGWSWIK